MVYLEDSFENNSLLLFFYGCLKNPKFRSYYTRAIELDFGNDDSWITDLVPTLQLCKIFNLHIQDVNNLLSNPNYYDPDLKELRCLLTKVSELLLNIREHNLFQWYLTNNLSRISDPAQHALFLEEFSRDFCVPLSAVKRWVEKAGITLPDVPNFKPNVLFEDDEYGIVLGSNSEVSVQQSVMFASKTISLDEDKSTTIKPKETIATYRTSLSNLPEQKQGITDLVREKEVLRYLERELLLKNSNFSSREREKITRTQNNFVTKYKSNATIQKIYDSICCKYMGLSLQQIRDHIKSNDIKIKTITGNYNTTNPRPYFNQILKNPQKSINEINYLAGESFKLICNDIRKIAENTSKEIIQRFKQNGLPLTYDTLFSEGMTAYNSNHKPLSQASFRNRPENLFKGLMNDFSNRSDIAFKHLAKAYLGFFSLSEEKVPLVRDILFNQKEFHSTKPYALLCYTSPSSYLLTVLAKRWKVDYNWVKNTLISWRRKMDNYLPEQFQINHVIKYNNAIVQNIRSVFVSRNDMLYNDFIKITSILQKKHMLHLLFDDLINLTEMFPNDLKASYIRFRNKILSTPSLQQIIRQLGVHTLLRSISPSEFLESAKMLGKEVRHSIEVLPKTSNQHRNAQIYLNKIEAFVSQIEFELAESDPNQKVLSRALQNFTLGRYAYSICKVIRYLPNFRKYARLFTAFRDVTAFALTKKFKNAITAFNEVFTPDNCLTPPFTSKRRALKTKNENRRKSRYLPVFYNRFVTPRDPLKTHSQTVASVTSLFIEEKPFLIGIPIYTLNQFNNNARKNPYKKDTFYFNVFPTKKMIHAVRNGAIVRDMLIHPPCGASRTIDISITFSSTNPEAFTHRGNFLSDWDRKFKNSKVLSSVKCYRGKISYHGFPSSKYLGVDFNRIGEYLVALGTPEGELDIRSLTKSFKAAYKKLELYRKKEIPSLQRSIEREESKHIPNKAKIGRLKVQIQFLHRKRNNIATEVKRQALMLYVYIAKKIGANFVSWDGIESISTKGKKGNLAQSISYLPRRKDLYDYFIKLINDLKSHQLLPNITHVITVSPFTSSVCGDCTLKNGNELSKTRSPTSDYDFTTCLVCGKTSNRHANAGQVASILMKRHVHAQSKAYG